MEEKRVIKISEVLDLFEKGYTKPEVGEMYNLTPNDRKLLFDHPKLKGVKIKKTTIIVEDDTEVKIKEPVQNVIQTSLDDLLAQSDEEEAIAEALAEMKQEQEYMSEVTHATINQDKIDSKDFPF